MPRPRQSSARTAKAVPVGSRKSQLQIRADLVELQRMLRSGVTLKRVQEQFGVGRSRAHELLKEAAALGGDKVTSTGRGESRIYSCADADPFRLELSEDEAVPAVILLRDAPLPLFGAAMGRAKRMSQRLPGVLDANTEARVRKIASRVNLRFHATRSISDASFGVIINAMADGSTIRFGYAKSTDRPSLASPGARLKMMQEWHAEPWAVFFAKRHLYAIVRPLEPRRSSASGKRDQYSDLRTIKLNRMHQPVVTGQSFQLPAWFSLAEYLEDAWDVVRFGNEPKSTVVIDVDPAAAENLIDTMWHSTQSVDRNDDGSVRLTKEGMVRMQFRVRGFNEIKYWVLQLGSFARVVKPEGLRRAVLDELKAMGERHGG